MVNNYPFFGQARADTLNFFTPGITRNKIKRALCRGFNAGVGEVGALLGVCYFLEFREAGKGAILIIFFCNRLFWRVIRNGVVFADIFFFRAQRNACFF